MGDLLTYKAHRLLLPAHSLAREYDYADISSVPAIGTTNPADPPSPVSVRSMDRSMSVCSPIGLQIGDWWSKAAWRGRVLSRSMS